MTGEYWSRRKNFGYYVLVKAWLESISAPLFVHNDATLLDVGPFDTPVVLWGTFNKRYTVDIEHDPKLPGVESHVVDFLKWERPDASRKLTVVTCLQVLEHLPDEVVYEFGMKLRMIARHTIVSVPYMWKAGFEAGHKQDPISFEKFVGFMGSPPDECAIVYDTKHHRIVGRWNNY